MKTVYRFFFAAVLISLCIQITTYYQIQLPAFVRFYLNDFLCMPIVFTICLKAVHLIKKDNSIRLPLAIIVTLTSLYAIYFELYLPGVTTRYTADLLDVVMYFAGAILFYFLQFRS
jgi:hypothetical protein